MRSPTSSSRSRCRIRSSLLRIINTPARGIGKTTVEQIEQYAQANDLSLLGCIGRMLNEQHFPTRAQAALAAFLRP